MEIIVNGQRRDCEPATLAELWRAEVQDIEKQVGEMEDSKVQDGVVKASRGYAIALNGTVVRRDAWARTPINEGDRIEIVRAVQGG